MRTQEEIVARARQQAKEDVFGWEVSEYLRALPREALESLKGDLLREDADLSQFNPYLTSDEAIKAQCIDYMEFAWEKAKNCRGLSAARSLAHYKAWLWMLGEDQFENVMDYQFYGKDELVRICTFLGLDSKQWDDGVRVNSESEL